MVESAVLDNIADFIHRSTHAFVVLRVACILKRMRAAKGKISNIVSGDVDGGQKLIIYCQIFTIQKV